MNQLLLPRLFPNQKPIPFRRKPESHSRDSEHFPRSGTIQCSPSANAATPQRFRLSPEWKGGRAEKEGGLKKYPPTNLANGDLLCESIPASMLASNLSIVVPAALWHSNRRKIPHAPKNGSDIFWRIPAPRRFCAPPRASPNCESLQYTSPGAFDSPSHTPPPAVLSCARLSHEKQIAAFSLMKCKPPDL